MTREDRTPHDSLAPHADGAAEEANGRPRRRRVLGVLAVGTGVIVLACVALSWRARAGVNKVALGASPRPVGTVLAKEAWYRPARSYVGTLSPWVEADVGPQFVSAYVESVSVRPGAVVRRHDVLATLDCANPSAASAAVSMQARSVEDRQRALADEAERVRTLLDGGFVAPNEVEQKLAQSSSERAQLLATRARLRAATLDVNDCVLRAPFDGEIATRDRDPGAFVHPGDPIVSIVDRLTVRFTADIPEKEAADVPPGAVVTVRAIASREERQATVARRSPKADPATRTVHVEVDLDDPNRTIPVGTTGLLSIDVGEPVRATAIPLHAATVQESKGSVFVVEGGTARRREVLVLGERAGILFVQPGLAPGAAVVTEGRALLHDGDPVAASPDEPPPPSPPPPPEGEGVRGGGLGRPQ